MDKFWFRVLIVAAFLLPSLFCPNAVAQEVVERPPRKTFMMLDAAYSVAPQWSFGVTVGQLGHFGWMANVMVHPHFHTGYDYKCDNTGWVGESRPFYTGKTATNRWSVTAGPTARLHEYIHAYAAIGFGQRNVFWQMEGGQWAKNMESSVEGVELETGLIFIVFGNPISIGVKSVSFKQTEYKIGLGMYF